MKYLVILLFLLHFFKISDIFCKKWDGILPWFSGSTCNCNGYSTQCIFDEELYNRTGHGGYCTDCSHNRDGPNCERCRKNYYQREDGYCLPCDCNEIGSLDLQCNREGKCRCKPGVAGEKCDRCDLNYYEFSPQGCKPCGCKEAGSNMNTPTCNETSGVCVCKENVEGKRCNDCKPGYFNLDPENEFGCTPCFCYGHASECDSAPGYSKILISSYFDRNSEKWTAQDENKRNIPIQYNAISQSIGVTAPDRTSIYFAAPDKFLGDQRASYNRNFQFNLRIGENNPSPTAADVYLEGGGTYVSNTIFGQGNKLPNTATQEFKFRLHEHPDFGWQPRLSPQAFMSILSNLTAIKIRATYTPNGVGFIDNVQLETAQRGAAGELVNWVEICSCPTGYVGQFCESCAPGYRHSPALGGPFMPCIPCDCNKHANICDSETGKCICEDHTAGDNCDLCAKGYYGNALAGSPNDCKPCGCPNNGACIIMPDETLVCLECPQGYAGPQCNLCSDGYYGDPKGLYGPAQSCKSCECNHNIDQNAVGNCNRTTGECLKCIHNTRGQHCEYCLPGFYGDALAVPQGDCKQCECYPPGTDVESGVLLCDQLSGQCYCKEHVTGRNCDQCENGYFNIESGDGCMSCNCDPIGSYNHTCNIQTGQCFCRPGITGVHCNKCEPYKFGFSTEGCKNCNCDPDGSLGPQCNSTGQCPCLNNVEGQTCDRCKENRYDKKQGCIECPACYNLVQDAVHEHQRKMKSLKKTLDDIANNPTVVNDADFEERLKQIQEKVQKLLDDAKSHIGGGESSLTERLNEVENKLKTTSDLLNAIVELADIVDSRTNLAKSNVTRAEIIIEQAKDVLNNALNYLNTEGRETLNRATERSREFGHQNNQMSEIAHAGRTKAFQLEEVAKRIEDLAFRARNISTDAYDMAKKSIDKLVNTSDNVNSFKNVIKLAKDKLETTKALSQNAQKRAQDIQKNALDVLGEANSINIPAVNTKQLKKEAGWKSDEAQKILDSLNKTQIENEPMIKDILEEKAKAEDLLRYSEGQQNSIKELKKEAERAKADAENAVSVSDGTLKEAEQTFKTLSEFDKKIQDSKEAALKALDHVADLKEDLQKSQMKINDAKYSLQGGAEANANRARDTAEMALEQYANNALKEANILKENSDELKKSTEELDKEASAFSDRIDETGNKLKKLEDQATNDNNLISEAKIKLGQVRSNSSEASKQVKKAIDEVDTIIFTLESLPQISTKELDDLEAKLEKAYEDFEKANLDDRIQSVRSEKQKQVSLIDNYIKEMDRLELEVANIKDIHDSLPDGCFKRTKLEP